MEKVIWKFKLEITGTQKIEMPIGADILTVQTQGGKAYFWALVDPALEKEIRTFEVFGTGHPIMYGRGVSRIHIETCQLGEGSFVFHVFETLGDS